MNKILLSEFQKQGLVPQGRYINRNRDGVELTEAEILALTVPILDIGGRVLQVGDKVAIPVGSGRSSATLELATIKGFKQYSHYLYDYSNRSEIPLDHVVVFEVILEKRKMKRESQEVAKIA